MFWQTLLAAAALAAHARAGRVAGQDFWAVAGRAPMDALERRMASAGEAADGVVFGRAATASASASAQSGGSGSGSIGNGVVFNADGTINMTAWDSTVTAACAAVLTRLPLSSNPSGTCICYNLPALDNTTGAFEADLRLYQLSAPRGAFAGIAPGAIKVSATYPAASLSTVTPATAAKLAVGRRQVADAVSGSTTATLASAAAAATSTAGLRLLQTYLFVGRIQQDKMQPQMSTAELEALVMPVVTLSATDASGQRVATNVSANEAAFVAGVFSDAVVQSSTTRAQAAVDAAVAGLHNGTVAFVLPGVQLLIFPVGLVVISVWLAVGVAVIGLGLLQRVQFRDQFRRRTQATTKPVLGRI